MREERDRGRENSECPSPIRPAKVRERVGGGGNGGEEERGLQKPVPGARITSEQMAAMDMQLRLQRACIASRVLEATSDFVPVADSQGHGENEVPPPPTMKKALMRSNAIESSSSSSPVRNVESPTRTSTRGDVKYACTFKCGFEGPWQAVLQHVSQRDCHLARQNDKNSTNAAAYSSLSASSGDEEEGTWAKHRPLRVDAQQVRKKLDTFVAPRSILKKSSSDSELDGAGQDGRHAAAGACLKKSNSYDGNVPSFGARKSDAVNLPHTTRDEGSGSKKGVAGFISKLSKLVRN